MGLSLKDSVAIAELVEFMYDLLPSSGMAQWKGHVSFRTVAQKVGVGGFWQEGSKKPMLANLFTKTLELKRQSFEPLVLEVVRAGIQYCRKNDRPLCSQDIEHLNAILLRIGFRFPDLWEKAFLDSLGSRPEPNSNPPATQASVKHDTEPARLAEQQQLCDKFYALFTQPDRQAAGLELERILNRLFELHELKPRSPFRVVGEQIDGSFELDHQTYLVEAKWERDPMPEKDLLIFRGKIEGKSAFTRGVFISLSGISAPAKLAIVYGKQPTFFVVDGHDLTMVMQGRIDLKGFLRQRRRLLSEEGLITVPFDQLASGSRVL